MNNQDASMFRAYADSLRQEAEALKSRADEQKQLANAPACEIKNELEADAQRLISEAESKEAEAKQAIEKAETEEKETKEIADKEVNDKSKEQEVVGNWTQRLADEKDEGGGALNRERNLPEEEPDMER